MPMRIPLVPVALCDLCVPPNYPESLLLISGIPYTEFLLVVHTLRGIAIWTPGLRHSPSSKEPIVIDGHTDVPRNGTSDVIPTF